MSKQEKADMKLAYQAAAEMAYIVAVGLSQAKQKRSKEKLFAKRQKRMKSKEQSLEII